MNSQATISLSTPTYKTRTPTSGCTQQTIRFPFSRCPERSNDLSKVGGPKVTSHLL